MKTLVTAIQKGGQGKTFATCHLAFDFKERGLKVCVIDLDSQGNASYTLDSFKTDFVASALFKEGDKDIRAYFDAHEHEGVAVITADAELADLKALSLDQAAKNFNNKIKALGDYFDVCLIDTEPSLGVAMTAALYSAGFVLSPIELETYSLNGLGKLVTVIANVRKHNSKLQFLGMVPNKVDSRKPRHKANLTKIQKAYPKFVIPHSIGARDSIAQALGEQMPVWKVKKTAARKAAAEVRALTEYVHTKMMKGNN